MYIGVITSSEITIYTAKKTTKFWKWHVTRTAWHQHLVKKSDARKQTCEWCIRIEYKKQQYYTFIIGWLSAHVTIYQGHCGVKLVQFSITHISCSVSWWGGYYTTGHNTLYFNARNFLIKAPPIYCFGGDLPFLFITQSGVVRIHCTVTAKVQPALKMEHIQINSYTYCSTNFTD